MSAPVELEQLFVYGIFLGEQQRKSYGMHDPHYDTVADFVTCGGYIVQAVPVEPGLGASLTGLVVRVDPDYWTSIDALEAGYERITVNTGMHGLAYMYAAPGTLAVLEKEEAYETEQA